MALASTSELGRILGVSHTAVGKAARVGRIKRATHDEAGEPLDMDAPPRFDTEQAMRDWAANSQRSAKRDHKLGGRPSNDGTPAKPQVTSAAKRPKPLADKLVPPVGDDDPDEGDDNAPNLNRATALEKHYKAKLAKLAYEEKAGTMVRIEAVAEVVDREYSRVRARLLAIASKLAPEVALSDDVAACRTAIELAVNDALSELAADAAAQSGNLKVEDDA